MSNNQLRFANDRRQTEQHRFKNKRHKRTLEQQIKKKKTPQSGHARGQGPLA